MVHGAKRQYSNKIISGKPADATCANALPPSVGAKKSGGFANRLLSLAQPRPVKKTSSQPSQPSCEYFFIRTSVTVDDNTEDIFLNTTGTAGAQRSVFNSGEGAPNYDIYKVRLVPVPNEDDGLVYIQGKNGKYMTVTGGTEITFEDIDDEMSEQRFKVTSTTNNTATIQTGGDRGGASVDYYLFADTNDGNEAKMKQDNSTIDLVPATQIGNGSC